MKKMNFNACGVTDLTLEQQVVVNGGNVPMTYITHEEADGMQEAMEAVCDFVWGFLKGFTDEITN
jgi:predicted hydrocarbon binding protein